MDRALLLQGHSLLDASVRRHEVELLLSIVALVGGVYVVEGGDDYAVGSRAPVDVHAGALGDAPTKIRASLR